MALEPTALLDILASKLAKISAMLAAQQRPLCPTPTSTPVAPYICSRYVVLVLHNEHIYGMAFWCLYVRMCCMAFLLFFFSRIDQSTDQLNNNLEVVRHGHTGHT
jgi:hypothetical protein